MSGERTYKHIDEIPLWNWIMLNERKDYKYLNADLSTISDSEGEKIAEALNKEITDIIGISDDFLILFQMQKDYNKMLNDLLITKDTEFIGLLKGKQLEIDRVMKLNDVKNTSLWRSVAMLSYMLKINIDLKNTVVREYIEFIQIANEITAKQNTSLKDGNQPD